MNSLFNYVCVDCGHEMSFCSRIGGSSARKCLECHSVNIFREDVYFKLRGVGCVIESFRGI